MNFYDALGLPEDASQEAIRAAYRKKAQKSHPDKGGDPQKFQIIQRAYDVLGDEQKRKRYDSGVNVEPPSIRTMAMQNLAAMLSSIINSGADLETLHVINRLREMCKEGIQKSNQLITQIQRNVKRIERAQKKLIFKGKGESFFIGALQATLQQAKAKLNEAEMNKELGAEMEKILADHDWAVEVKPAPTSELEKFKNLFSDYNLDRR